MNSEVQKILRDHGAVLVRQKKHQVWKFPDGKVYVQASTPSDQRAAANQLSKLRNMLGLHGERGIPGDRREKVLKVAARPIPKARLSLSAASVPLAGLRDSLMAVVRRSKPRHVCCFPMEKRTILVSPVSIWMDRIIRIFPLWLITALKIKT